MSDPIGSFSGIASGIQWRDMIDQIMVLERSRTVAPVAARLTEVQKRGDGWRAVQSAVAKLTTAARALRDASAFGSLTASTMVSGGSGRATYMASAASGAVPGSYKVEVLELARAEKLSGDVVASATTALGIGGEFVINGRRVELLATDTLNGVRDKINAVNGGSAPSGVAATVLSTGSGAHRLVLTSAHSGAAGIELVDGATGPLRQLGVVDAATTANLTADGGVQSNRFASVNTAVATMLGVVTTPAPATVTIGGRTVTVDLAVDSLSAIAARIQAAGGSAELVTDPAGGSVSQRLVTGGTVSATTPDGERALALLGFVQPGRAAVAQSVATESAYTDAGGAPATATTLLTDLRAGGQPVGLAVGDTFNVRGTRADGSAVSLDFVIGAADTLQTVLDRINDATGGFGAGARTATAVLDGGRIRLTDDVGGDSQLSLSLTATTPAGDLVGLGRASAETVGRAREVVAGADARYRIDDVLLTSPQNTVTSSLPGVTLNLLAAEPGVVGDLTIARDDATSVKAVKALADAYNEAQRVAAQQRAPGGALQSNGALRAAMSSITSVLLSDVVGMDGAAYPRGALLGLTLSKTGTLELDEAALMAALASSPADVQRLFATDTVATGADLSLLSTTALTQPGSYGVEITQTAARGAVTGAGFGGTYVDDGTADTITVGDAALGTSATVELRNGDTLSDIVQRLNTELAARNVAVTASDEGGQLKLESHAYGAAGLTVAFAGGGADGSAQLGVAAGSHVGRDVAGHFTVTTPDGTVTTHAATGSGRTLTGAEDTPAVGLAVEYAGSAVGTVGSVRFVLGLGGMIERAADAIGRTGDGVAQGQIDAGSVSVATLEQRVADVEARLEKRREALVRQFSAMEAALSRIQAQGSWLTQQLSALNGTKQQS